MPPTDKPFISISDSLAGSPSVPSAWRETVTLNEEDTGAVHVVPAGSIGITGVEVDLIRTPWADFEVLSNEGALELLMKGTREFNVKRYGFHPHR